MGNEIAKMKLTLRNHLLKSADIQARIGDRVYGHHLTDEDSGTAVHPLVIIELNAGAGMYNDVVQSMTFDVYVYSKVGDDEASRIYDLVHNTFHAECAGEPELGTSFLVRESERPIEGFNRSTKSHFLRGTFQATGVT